MGFDIIHINLHKTFSTPHGGGGPGAGPVGVKERLKKYLPIPRIYKDQEGFYSLQRDRKDTIGPLITFHGNFLVVLRAYVYMKLLGADGLKDVSESAVLNANYMMHHLKEEFDLPYDRICMHEFVLSSSKQQKYGVYTKNIAKRLIDKGYHPPTTYFPLIVDEALMVEPTETENKETLDQFISDMKDIAQECRENPEHVKLAPHTTPVRHLDEVAAARKPKLRWYPQD
jgi:glycine dehydrogenase subunit 2